MNNSSTEATNTRPKDRRPTAALLAGATSVLVYATPALAHEGEPPPYPEPFESATAPEVMTGPPTILYAGLAVLVVTLVAMMLGVARYSRKNRHLQTVVTATDEPTSDSSAGDNTPKS